MKYSQKCTAKNHLLVFGVNSWHKIVLAVCTFYSQNITDNIARGYAISSFPVYEGQESSQADYN